jgi:hypothetical protein
VEQSSTALRWSSQYQKISVNLANSLDAKQMIWTPAAAA